MTEPIVITPSKFESLKNKTQSTKKFVSKHRVGIAVTATSIAWFAVMVNRAGEWNEFLKDNDLFDKFYALDELTDPLEIAAMKA